MLCGFVLVLWWLLALVGDGLLWGIVSWVITGLVFRV